MHTEYRQYQVLVSGIRYQVQYDIRYHYVVYCTGSLIVLLSNWYKVQYK